MEQRFEDILKDGLEKFWHAIAKMGHRRSIEGNKRDYCVQI